MMIKILSSWKKNRLRDVVTFKIRGRCVFYGPLLGTLQGSSGLLTLEQFFPLGGLEGPPRRSSQGGGLNKHTWNFPLNLGLF